jgi:hypothetical protein
MFQIKLSELKELHMDFKQENAELPTWRRELLALALRECLINHFVGY